MLRSIVICPDEELARCLESAVTLTDEVTVHRTLNRYPAAIDLVRTLRAHAPDLVFLSFESIDKAQQIVKLVEQESDGLQIVAIHRQFDSNILRETMRSGVREFVSYPFEARSLRESIAHVKAQIQRKPPSHEATNQIFSFLPSKAGAGTSTVALNVSAALSRKADTRVLLSDFDLNSGMMRFLLKLENEYSVIDAVENSLRVDENLWPQLVTSMGNLDVLHAGRVNPNLRIEGSQIRNLIDFMRRNYKALCFDLSGNLEKYSIEIMQESKRVLLVCTPEIPSLHLAREKLQFLRTFDLDGRVAVVLNRCSKTPLFSKKQVEDLLGVPVVQIFANDYNGINKAIAAGSWIDPESDMGKSFAEFAQGLIERKSPVKTVEKKKFLEFFAVSNRTLVPRQK